MCRALATYLLLFLFTATAFAADRPDLQRGDGSMLHGGPLGAPTKAARDSFLLMGPTGSGAPYIGDFEVGSKALDPALANGWTSKDMTQSSVSHWQVSDYHAVNGNLSAWCGDLGFPACEGSGNDPEGGYGNNWNDMLEWRQVVDDPNLGTTLSITATANIHSEDGYDGTTLQVEKFDTGFVDVNYWDGEQTALAISETVTYEAGEYMGPGGDEVVVIWHFESDGGWSDEDCSFPSSGGIQLDDVTIASSNGAGTGGVVDFEDGTFGPFGTRFPVGVGDFAKIWRGLEDMDPCLSNYSRQVAFIDDGVVVPGTGGSLCLDWCYGPFGFIVNTTGGLAGPESHLHNAIISPVMEWSDPNHTGVLFEYGVYRHEDLGSGAAGIFQTWDIRSATSEAALETAPWVNRNFMDFGGLGYFRRSWRVDDLVVSNPTHFQVRLAVVELGWVWGWTGDNGTPAPYFDNVRVTTFPVIGPGLVSREIDLANDAFPESGTVDMGVPGDLWCRFDMGRNISAPVAMRRDFGDSLVFDCAVIRRDAVLEGLPEIVYRVKTNPLFDPYRMDPTPYAGRADCGIVTNSIGTVVPNRFYADLPDTGWLYPGDVVHYYLEASDRDTIGGSVETAIMPADTTGFHEFYDALNYDPSFTVRCLPTITSMSGHQPPIIFWNDFGNRGGMNYWFTSFNNLGLLPGTDYDHYYTNGPASGVGNGLGGKATALQLAGYETLLYTAGDLGSYTLSNGDFEYDSGEDVQTLTAWLDSGGKNAFMTGDDLAADLFQSGLMTGAFLSDMMGATFVAGDLRELIGGQTAPRVLITNMNPVFISVASWIAYGGCTPINIFDAVTAPGADQRLALFAGLDGDDGGYPYSACTIASGVGLKGTSEVISMPYDFKFIYNDPDEGGKADATLAARVRVLKDVLARFGVAGSGWPSAADTPALQLSARNYPNPFNPVTTIRYVAPRSGEMTVKIYSVRGELVRTLINGAVEQGPDSIDWNGRDERGRGAASGVYFYEVRMHNDVQIGKMTLVK